jgi:hypothetical protein
VVAAFDEATRNLLDGRNFATVATLNPDGGPQTSVVWIVREGDTVAFSTTAARRGRYDDGRTGLCHMYDASTTSASRWQISTS